MSLTANYLPRYKGVVGGQNQVQNSAVVDDGSTIALNRDSSTNGNLSMLNDKLLTLGTTTTNAATKITAEFDATTTGIGLLISGTSDNAQVLNVNPGATVKARSTALVHSAGSGNCDDLIVDYKRAWVTGNGDAGLTVVGDAPRVYVGVAGTDTTTASAAYGSQPWAKHAGTGAITAMSALSALVDVETGNFTANTVNAGHFHIEGSATVTGQFDGVMIEAYPDVNGLDSGLAIVADSGAEMVTGIRIAGAPTVDLTLHSGNTINNSAVGTIAIDSKLTGFTGLESSGSSALYNSIYNFYKTKTGLGDAYDAMLTGSMLLTSTTGPGTNTVPIGFLIDTDTTGGIPNHNVSIVGRAGLNSTVATTYVGVEGKVYLNTAGSVGEGLFAMSYLNNANNTGSTSNGLVVTSSALQGSGTGTSIGGIFSATGGALNYDIFLSGSKSISAWNTAVNAINTISFDDQNLVLSPVTKTTTAKQIESTLATGTSPLDVDSTTVNTNLNADMVDGIHGFGYALQFSGAAFNPDDGTPYYLGGLASLAPNAVAALAQINIPKTGTVKAIYIQMLSVGPGSNETSTIAFRLNNTTDTTISSAVKNDAALYTFSKTDLAISVTAGDKFEIKWTTPTWGTNPTTVYVSGTAYIE